MVVLLLILSIVIPMALLVIASGTQKASESLFCKSTPFECGFEEFSSARLSFSMKFFLIVLVFLIFDVEIALVLPLPISHGETSTIWLWSALMVVLVLIAGVVLELAQGSLSWVD